MGDVKETPATFSASLSEARAKLFTHGGSQAVRLPKAFRFEGTEVLIRKQGNAVVLEPVVKTSRKTPEEWAAFWKSIDDIGGEPMDYPPRDDSPWREAPEW